MKRHITDLDLIHWENSPITQSIPKPTLLSWGNDHRKKILPHPWPLRRPSLRVIIRPLSPIVLKIFDVFQVCHECLNLLKISSDIEKILEMAYLAHCTSNWKFIWISRTSISRVAPKSIWCCSCDQWFRWDEIVQWAMKIMSLVGCSLYEIFCHLHWKSWFPKYW